MTAGIDHRPGDLIRPMGDRGRKLPTLSANARDQETGIGSQFPSLRQFSRIGCADDKPAVPVAG